VYYGNVDAAMKTALRLVDYEDVLDAKDVYSLIAVGGATALVTFIRVLFCVAP
jgi:hypothetical protein